MISINRIRDRKSDFLVNEWLMDSGAFTEISTHGRWRSPVEDYAKQVVRWSSCGTMLAAVSQDYMCEDFILAKTGLSISEHQRLTTERYRQLVGLVGVPVLPVLQGYDPRDYAAHINLYGDLLKPGAWVGVGSVCKRNSNPETVETVLRAIKATRQDLRLHGFGLKITALENPNVRAMLHSSDSMAWSFAGRKEGEAHDPRLALTYCAKIQGITNTPGFVQEHLFQWWS
jgi:hypothetical protein